METVINKKKRTGRPAKAIKKEVRACVRFTRNEYFIIKEKAAKAGVNTSTYLRQIAINATIKTRLTDEERRFFRELVGMANNINQVAKTCHQEGAMGAMIYFEGFRKQFDELLKKLKS